MSARLKLDDIDRKILIELQQDGRITNVDLAGRVGISAPPCLRRVRALEEAGLIKGYRARINEKAAGFDITVFALISLKSQAEADLVAFQDAVNGWPFVRECYLASGETDFIMKCVAPGLPEFQSFVIKDLTNAPNVASVRTMLVMGETKNLGSAPLGEV